MGGIYLAGTYKDFIAARVDLSIGTVEAADSTLKGATDKYAVGRLVRNLSFKSNIFEIAAAVELHPLFLRDYIETDPPRWSPYVFAGIGWTKFNPKGKIAGDNSWYELSTLHLEGQGFKEYPNSKPYKKGALAFPVGIGVRYEAGQLFTFRFELARHFLATDYLDDVGDETWIDPATFYSNPSVITAKQAATAVKFNDRTPEQYRSVGRPRGNSSSNDAFWNFLFKIGINLNRMKR